MRVLTTGANGHLGANVARSLLARGYQVVPFVRRGADLRGLQGLGLDYVYGDMMDEKSLLAAAEGCDALIHMAATYRYWAKDPAEILQPALVGTRNALNLAKAAGIQRVVYTSSTWAVGLSEDPNHLLTASVWNNEARNPYAIAKTQAERDAWHMAEELGVAMISICSGGLIGPYNYNLTPSMALLRDLINGRAPVYKGGQSFVDVRDVAEIHAAAVEMGETGQRYIAAGENLLIEEYAQLITKLTGIRPMRLPGGRKTFQVVATLAELGGAITRSEPLVTRALADEMGERYMYNDCDNTFRTFGVTRCNTEEMFKDGIRWMLHLGLFKPKVAAIVAERFSPDPTWVA